MVLHSTFLLTTSRLHGSLTSYPQLILQINLPHLFRICCICIAFTVGSKLIASRSVPKVPSVPSVSSALPSFKKSFSKIAPKAPLAPKAKFASRTKPVPFVPSVKRSVPIKRAKPTRLVPLVRRVPIVAKPPLVRVVPKRRF